jgi:hypothetical protein
MTIMIDYNYRAMTGLSDDDNSTLAVNLAEQLAALLKFEPDRYEAHYTAEDALANTWQPELTARAWLAAAGDRLNVDTSVCVGV